MSWTDERVEALKAMWNDGKSASQIAKELGGVTRNAVIGKVHRLGLSNRTTGAEPAETEETQASVSRQPETVAEVDNVKQTAEPEPEVSTAPQATVRELPITPRNRIPGKPLPPQPTPNEISEEALANLKEVAKKAKRQTLMQLTERTCKWPVGDPATEDFWFCGLPTAAGKPYCDAHVAVAFQPMSARRDRRAGGR